jgi:HPt (histidine-containing phosphotransfer) domain-containing protein
MITERRPINWDEVRARLDRSQQALEQSQSVSPERLEAVYRERAARLAARSQERTSNVGGGQRVLVVRVGGERHPEAADPHAVEQVADASVDPGPGRFALPPCPVAHDRRQPHVGCDQKLLRELAILFGEDYPRSAAELRAAVAVRDPRRVNACAHAVKVALATLGAIAALWPAERLEKMGHDGVLDAGEIAADQLDREVARLLPLLTAFAAGSIPELT